MPCAWDYLVAVLFGVANCMEALVLDRAADKCTRSSALPDALLELLGRRI
jgi:hypothetical protein